MRAGDLAAPFPVVNMDTPAADAARLLAGRDLPGLIVTDAEGRPLTVLSGTQVLQMAVSRYCQDDLALARVVDEPTAGLLLAELAGPCRVPSRAASGARCGGARCHRDDHPAPGDPHSAVRQRGAGAYQKPCHALLAPQPAGGQAHWRRKDGRAASTADTRTGPPGLEGSPPSSPAWWRALGTVKRSEVAEGSVPGTARLRRDDGNRARCRCPRPAGSRRRGG